MRRCLLLATVCLLPAIAAAQPVHGLYVSADVGANFAGSLESAQDTTQLSTNPGPLGVLAAGWGFGNGLRTELEGSYRSNGIDGISTRRDNGLFLPLGNVDGRMASYAMMANVLYDVPVTPFGLPVQPYIGVGVGYAWMGFNGAGGTGLARFTLPGNNTYTGPDRVSFGSAGAFAYQAIVGAAMPLRVLPGLDLTLEYRFFGTSRADVPVDRVAITTNLINGTVPSASTRDSFSLHDQTVLIGLRFRFGAP